VRLRSVLWLCLAGLAAAGVLRSPVLAFAVLAASAIAAVVLVVRRGLYRGVTFERTLSRRVVPWGGELEVALSITNDKLLPLVWLQVRDRWPGAVEPLGFELRRISLLDRQELLQTFSVRWYERLRRRYRVRCHARGVHQFGPAEAQAGDPFGIAGVGATWEERREVVVLPRVLDVRGLDLLLGRPLVEEAAERSLIVDPTALRGVRPYRPGDPMRAVNWRATARTAELSVNEFDPSSLAAVRLLLDVSSRHRSWEAIAPGPMEVLCVVTASLAAGLSEAGLAVGFASNASDTGDHRAVDLAPAPGALPDVLEAIARLRPFTTRDFGALLLDEAQDASSTAECVVVTTRLGAAARAAVARLRRERPTTVIVVGGPGEDEAGFADLVVSDTFDWRTADALALQT
jgi:uncharacterized protein (DUF58 family)